MSPDRDAAQEDKYSRGLDKTSQEISHQLDLSIKEIEELKEGDEAPQREDHGVLSEGENYLNDQAACVEKVNHLENKIKILANKLKYIQELIEENALLVE